MATISPSSDRPGRYSSSMTPENAEHFERTLELGKAIAADLDEHDLLGRWMAHHISDLITRAEAAAGPASAELRGEAAEAIIGLWNNRSSASMRHKPLISYEPVFAALERLGGGQSPWEYFRFFEAEETPDEDDVRSVPTLKLAIGVEEAVRDFVLQAIMLAEESATQREHGWIRLSDHLNGDDRLRAMRMLHRLRNAFSDLEHGSQDSPQTSPAVKLVSAASALEERIRQMRQALEATMVVDDNRTESEHDDQ